MDTPGSLFRWDIINRIAAITGATRYLEIGTAFGTTLAMVNLPVRVGVDPVPQVGAVRACSLFAPMSSDEFFRVAASMVAGPFDLVFIDGWHEAGQAYRDVEGSRRLLSDRGVIVLHDCNPADEAMQGPWRPNGEWTGDVWKTVARLRGEGHHEVRVVDCDYGVGVVVPGGMAPERPPVTLGQEPWELGWADLEAHRRDLLGLVGPDEWERWFVAAWTRNRRVDVG